MQNRPPGPRQKKRLAGPATKMQLPNAPVKTPFSIPFARSFIALCHDVRNSQHPIFPSSNLRLGRELGLAVRNLDTELLGACNNFYPLSRRDGVSDPVEHRHQYTLSSNILAGCATHSAA